MPRSLKLFLWVAVIVATIGLGGKLFDLIILAPAWAAGPPESLKLMPYGPKYPLDPGDFFIPVSIIIIVSYSSALIAGWKALPSARMLLVVPVLLVLIGAIATPTLFWPMIRELYGAGIGTVSYNDDSLRALVRRWFVLDTLRTLLLIAGLICHVIVLNRRWEDKQIG
jgi:hypothetical protein